MPSIIRGAPDELALQASVLFYEELKQRLHQERIAVALPGGTSVLAFFAHVAKHAHFLSEEQWRRVHVFWCDERCVAPDHPDSNFLLAHDLLQAVPAAHVHRIKGELGAHAALLQVPALDIVVLGVGPDGHIASLFPHHPALAVPGTGYVAVLDAPKPPPQRITLTRGSIAGASCCMLFFLGEQKAAALAAFLDEQTPVAACPAKIALAAASCFVFTDKKEKNES